MAAAAVIGAALVVEGYALAGAAIYPADSRDEATAAFDALPADIALLLVTATAAQWLAGRLDERPGILTAVMDQ